MTRLPAVMALVISLSPLAARADHPDSGQTLDTMILDGAGGSYAGLTMFGVHLTAYYPVARSLPRLMVGVDTGIYVATTSAVYLEADVVLGLEMSVAGVSVMPFVAIDLNVTGAAVAAGPSYKGGAAVVVPVAGSFLEAQASFRDDFKGMSGFSVEARFRVFKSFWVGGRVQTTSAGPTLDSTLALGLIGWQVY